MAGRPAVRHGGRVVTSAGLLLFRRRPDVPGGVEVLVGHMGGPFWARKDAGAWTIPKGEPEPGEELHAAAERELAEELGLPVPPHDGDDLDLGEVRQRAGKVVRAWAREADLDVGEIRSNLVEVAWPPRSGRTMLVPELDRAAWVPLPTARGLVVAAQAELLDRLAALLADGG